MPGPKAASPIPEKELASATPSLIEAMTPSEPADGHEELAEISSSELATAEPETLKRPPKERKPILPETTQEAEVNRTLRNLHTSIQDAERNIHETTTWDNAAPFIHELNKRGKQAEAVLARITEAINDATEQDVAPLREQQRALREGIEQLMETRDNLLQLLPQESTPSETHAYHAEEDLLARIRQNIRKSGLTPKQRAYHADLLRTRAQHIEQQELQNPEEQRQREQILEKIHHTVKHLDPEKPLGRSRKTAAEIRLYQQLEDAAKRVRDAYGGREPEELLNEGGAEGYRMTRRAANFLRGLVGEADPLEEWEAIQERIQQHEATKRATSTPAAKAPSKPRRKVA